MTETGAMASSSPSKSSQQPQGFWKKSSSAIPGRTNPSKMVAASAPAATFQDFEQSVSDVWDINDSERPPQLQRLQIDCPDQQARPVVERNSVPDIHMSRRMPPDGASSAAAASAPSSKVTKPPSNENKKFAKTEALVASPSIELEELRRLSWPGLSPRARAKAWKILCGYLPGNAGRQEEVIQRKQEEYQRYVTQYFAIKDQDDHQDTYRQIHIDIPRMSPVVGLFQQLCVQEMFERILYIWAIRHPASGYVQGINDLVTPFFLVFLQDGLEDFSGDRVPTDIEVDKLPLELRNSVEADSYWCLTVVLDGIQDNYTFAQPGIQRKVRQLEELIQRIDGDLHNHLVSHDVAYLQFAFRWMNNLLMRELPVKATIRLWDTYLAQADGFSHFHLYVCAAFLIHWKSELLKKSDFHTLLMFLQNLPTAKWGDAEINLLVAEAYRLSYLFADAPSHLATASTKMPASKSNT